MFMWADNGMPFLQKKRRGAAKNNSVAVADTVLADTTARMSGPDTTKMDSLQLAIYRHNRAVDDSIRLDSLNRKKANGIDAPVNFASEDSMVYDAGNKLAYLFGASNVK